MSAGLSWTSIGERRKLDLFFRKLEEAFHRVPRFVEQVLQAALQHNNSLCFLARIAPRVNGADDFDSIGSSKVLLDNNSAVAMKRGAGRARSVLASY